MWIDFGMVNIFCFCLVVMCVVMSEFDWVVVFIISMVCDKFEIRWLWCGKLVESGGVFSVYLLMM